MTRPVHENREVNQWQFRAQCPTHQSHRGRTWANPRPEPGWRVAPPLPPPRASTRVRRHAARARKGIIPPTLRFLIPLILLIPLRPAWKGGQPRDPEILDPLDPLDPLATTIAVTAPGDDDGSHGTRLMNSAAERPSPQPLSVCAGRGARDTWPNSRNRTSHYPESVSVFSFHRRWRPRSIGDGGLGPVGADVEGEVGVLRRGKLVGLPVAASRLTS